jgi:hypothetical protein
MGFIVGTPLHKDGEPEISKTCKSGERRKTHAENAPSLPYLCKGLGCAGCTLAWHGTTKGALAHHSIAVFIDEFVSPDLGADSANF